VRLALFRNPSGGSYWTGRSGAVMSAGNLAPVAYTAPAVAVGEPVAPAVITATGYGYIREDGVAVIPLGARTA
jgi:hypothetical protein